MSDPTTAKPSATVAGEPDTVAESRRRLLEVIGDEPDLTLVRAGGNLGDELIRAGTHQLLAGRRFREIGLDELPAASGGTLLLPGSGAWCRTYHEWMPRALGIAELRFARVIVLPSSFDPGEDSVRRALEATRATVFARERASLRLITPLCDAGLAHDCAFFFDFSPWSRVGSGILNAFRADAEAGGVEPPPENRDISLEASGLDEWLGLIAAHAVVRTDRAHVMIAAALMGKTVEAVPSRYHKIPALADTWLRGFPVSVAGTAPIVGRVATAVEPIGSGRVTAVVVTRDRLEGLERTVRSVLRAGEVGRVVVIDSNSDPVWRPRFETLAADDPRVTVRRVDRDVGRAGGRRLGVELAETEFVLLLDDGVEVGDGAVGGLMADLDGFPGAAGVTAAVVDQAGAVIHCGGSLAARHGVAHFGLDTRLEMVPGGPTAWLPSGCALVRRSALEEIPIDAEMVPAYEDAEWSLRVSQAGLGLRRYPGARVVSAHGSAAPPSSLLAASSARVERLLPVARFLERYGLVLNLDLSELLPELSTADGTLDMAAARRLLEDLSAHGADEIVIELMNGSRAPSASASSGEHRPRRRLPLGLRLPFGGRSDHEPDGS